MIVACIDFYMNKGHENVQICQKCVKMFLTCDLKIHKLIIYG